MSVRQTDDPRSRRMFEAALVLILCKDERPMSPKLRQRLDEWVQDSSENARNLLQLEALASELNRLRLVDRSAQLAKSKPHAPDIPLVPRRAVLIGGTAAAVALPLGYLISTRYDGAPIRHVSLDDGSVMHVLRGTDYDIEFSSHQRLIRLTRGEAVFEVAKDSHRPFVVRTPRSDSIAVGTRFGVVTDTAATTTTVSKGLVRVVVPAGNEQTAGTPLQAGEEIRVLAGASRAESVMTVNAERKTSWAAGWLEFDGETAAEAVKTFNRFSDVNIEIRQPELAALRLTYHRFEIDKPQSFANSIARSLNTTVTRNPARKSIYIGDVQSKQR
jgi:transmembrane sensor